MDSILLSRKGQSPPKTTGTSGVACCHVLYSQINTRNLATVDDVLNTEAKQAVHAIGSKHQADINLSKKIKIEVVSGY